MNILNQHFSSILLLILGLSALSCTEQVKRFGRFTIYPSGMKPITVTGHDAKLFGRTCLFTGLLSLGVILVQLLFQNDLGILAYIPILFHIANVTFLMVILLLRRIARTGDKLKQKPKNDELA